ncbi:MAG: DUF3047 domain-containing protein [Balneolaceae bacterium]
MKYSFTLLFLIFFISFFHNSLAQTAINTLEFGDDGVVYLEDFEKYETGGLPVEWYNRDGDRVPATYSGREREGYQYKVERENDNQFLRYAGTEAKHLNFPLADKKNLNIHETPLLRWRWRIHNIPAGGNEDIDDRNDVAASVYVVFDFGRVLFRRVPKSIRYTWSSTLAEGKELSKFFGNQKVVVLGSGHDGRGEWKTFERNIVEDYRRLFGDDPPRIPLAILILSDGDNTNSYVQADYDDFEFHQEAD